MLQATLYGSGFGAATPDPNIKALQVALTAFAVGRNYPQADPHGVDGILGAGTRNAVLALLPYIPKLPTTLKTLVTLATYGAVLSTSVTAQVDSIIKSQANVLTAAVKAATIGASAPAPDLPTPGASAGTKITAYSRKLGAYRIAVTAPGLHGLAAAYVETAPSTTKPTDATEVTETTFNKAVGTWYTTWWGIASIVGGVAAVGGGAWWALKS